MKNKVSTTANKKTPVSKYQKGGKKVSESEKLMSQAKEYRKKAANTPSQNYKRDFTLTAKDLEAKAKALKAKEGKSYTKPASTATDKDSYSRFNADTKKMEYVSKTKLPSNYTPPKPTQRKATEDASYNELMKKWNSSDKSETKPAPKPVPKPAPKPAPKTGGKTVSELWKEKTGTSWAEAKKQGLTDGSMEKNLKVLKDLKAGKYDKKESVDRLPTKKVTSVDNPVTDKEKEIVYRNGGKKRSVKKVPMYKRGGKKK